jgi:uncharacterized protein (TIGR03067 family)
MSPLLLGLSLVVAAPALKDKPGSEGLAGQWVVEAYLFGGEMVAPGVHIQFSPDGRATCSGGPPQATHEGTYTFDRKADPARIDVSFRRAAPMVGIFKCDGDALVICFGDTARPAEFTSPAGTAVGLLTLRRTKKD